MIHRIFQANKRLIPFLLLPALWLLAIQAPTQHTEHSPWQVPGKSEPSMSGSMMSPDMMAQHQKMTTQHQAMGKAIDQLIKNLSALENEKDPALLEKKLAEQGILLRKLQSDFQQSSGVLDSMEQMIHHFVVMQHGEMAMGFSQTQTTHHFLLKKDGGVIQVEVNDPKDTQNRDLIRTHLKHIAQAFAAGDFSDPLAVHSKFPDGVPVMKQLKGNIHYTFEQSPNGARVIIHTTNTQAREAIYQFLRFQITDHQTGDSMKVN